MLRSLNSAAIAIVLLLPFSVYGQSAAQIEGDDVARVASHLACQCGVCKSSVACQMPGGCGFCKRMKTKIAGMQNVGMSDQQIIDAIVQQDGTKMYLTPPGTWGWLTPFAAVALGLLVIAFFIRRSLQQARPATIPAVEPAALHRYHERIDRDLEKLE